MRSVVVFLLLLISTTFLRSQDISCNGVTVGYTKPPDAISAKIKISADPVGEHPPMQKQISTQSTRWLGTVEPDYMKTGPWSTVLFVGKRGSDKPFLKVSFQDHGNTFSAKWLNEKLIFIEVWWGRAASSDLILDVDKRTFIYNELARYDELISPCKQY
jgi:hypothetical protein